MYIAAKSKDMNGGPLSARNFVGTPNLPNQYSKKIVATVIAVAFVIGIDLVSFDKPHVITTTYWLALYVSVRVL